MREGEECPLFRRPENLSFGKGIGYRDMDMQGMMKMIGMMGKQGYN